MRILYNSKDLQFKDPFGTLVPGQECTLTIHIPSTVQASSVDCLFSREDGTPAFSCRMEMRMQKGAYDVFQGTFSFAQRGLYFYFFHIHSKTHSFRLFKVGDETNMEAGDLWQVSCVPEDAHTPDWAKGAVMYQIFPDRFCRSGSCDLTGKLEPYYLHDSWYEELRWQPTAEGKILNNDFYGGNFRGIEEKLDYLASLGVTVLYLNPISKSFSSHRYDTGDYKTPDPMLGTTEDFVRLCDAVHAKGMRLILDGVFSHTGSDSLYFDRYRHFGGNGAYCRKDSPYSGWYHFRHWPDHYASWWDFDTLPTVNKLDPAFIQYIITGEDSVVAHWLKLGADGFRLDVADELPNEFLLLLRQRVRELKSDAIVIGEVWEDASNKTAYGVRKRYFVDGSLDSCMNYPFRTAIIRFIRGQDGGQQLKDTVLSILENYPREVAMSNMNMLGTHDTPRILTALVDDFDGSLEERSQRRLSRNQWDIAYERFLAASFLQFTLPGMPCIYYGDEAGMEGGKDPFNRRPFPWGREEPELIRHFRRLGKLRQTQDVLRLGDITFLHAADKHLAFRRSYQGRTLHIYCNRSADSWAIPAGKVLLGYCVQIISDTDLVLGPRGFCITEE